MGSGIAQKLAQEGLTVILVDLDEAKAKAGMARVEASLEEAVKKKVLDQDRASAVRSRVTATSDWTKLSNVDIVIEAVFEDLKVKKDVFARLDAVVKPDAIL